MLLGISQPVDVLFGKYAQVLYFSASPIDAIERQTGGGGYVLSSRFCRRGLSFAFAISAPS